MVRFGDSTQMKEHPGLGWSERHDEVSSFHFNSAVSFQELEWPEYQIDV